VRRVPVSAANGSQDGESGPEQSVADSRGELGGQFPQQVDSGQGRGGQDAAWTQRSGQAGQRRWERGVMQGADWHDGVLTSVRQRLVQHVSENARDVRRCHPPGLFDHGGTAVNGINVFRALGQFYGESACATADLKNSFTWTWQIPQKQAVVISV